MTYILFQRGSDALLLLPQVYKYMGADLFAAVSNLNVTMDVMDVIDVDVLVGFRAWDGQSSEGALQRREDQHIRSPGTLGVHNSTPCATVCAGFGVYDVFGADSTSHEARAKGKSGFVSRCAGKECGCFQSCTDRSD